MKIEQYDAVLLKDGRRGCVVEVNSETNFDIDVGSSPKDWETLWGVSIDEIEKIIEPITSVMCPLIDENIKAIECIENRDCVDGMLVLSLLPKKFKTKDNFIEICKNCKWHNY